MFEFEIEGTNLRVNPKDPFGTGHELIIYLEKQSGSEWVPVAYPSIYASDCKTKEATYAAVEAAYIKLNEALTRLFGKDVGVPTEGFELVRHLISKDTTLVGINLNLKEAD